MRASDPPHRLAHRYEGLTTAEIRRLTPGWTVWGNGVPGGKTIDAVTASARRVIARGHCLRVPAACWLDLLPAAGACFALGTASVSTPGHERETPAITRWNQTPVILPPGFTVYFDP
jgi:hypothetical protein